MKCWIYSNLLKRTITPKLSLSLETGSKMLKLKEQFVLDSKIARASIYCGIFKCLRCVHPSVTLRHHEVIMIAVVFQLFNFPHASHSNLFRPKIKLKKKRKQGRCLSTYKVQYQATLLSRSILSASTSNTQI